MKVKCIFKIFAVMDISLYKRRKNKVEVSKLKETLEV